MTTLRKYLIQLIILVTLAIIGVTYIAPMVGERLSAVLNQATSATTTTARPSVRR